MPIMLGVAMAASKFSSPAWTWATRSSEPTMSAPAASASRAFSPSAKTATRTDLPVPWGSAMEPRTFWSALRVSTPRRTATSTVSSNLAGASSLASSMASFGE